MSIKTIECRIAAKPESLKHLWELMTLKNTPLINELLAQVPNHPNFERGSLRRKPPQRQVSLLKSGLKKGLYPKNRLESYAPLLENKNPLPISQDAFILRQSLKSTICLNPG